MEGGTERDMHPLPTMVDVGDEKHGFGTIDWRYVEIVGMMTNLLFSMIKSHFGTRFPMIPEMIQR